MAKSVYATARTGEHPDEILGVKKVRDLRYGTNPGQTAATYNYHSLIGSMRELKSGKGGMSQTNVEDVFYAFNILKYFDRPCCAVMKHLNPSGFAKMSDKDIDNDPNLKTVYKLARDCDYQAALGSVVGFYHTCVDRETADEIMKTFVEAVAAPAFEHGVMDVFNNGEKYGRNRDIRVIEVDDVKVNALPKFCGDKFLTELKRLPDGTIIESDPYRTSIINTDDLKEYLATDNKMNLSEQGWDDLLTAWYVCTGVRSNGIVMVKNGYTVGVGTGQQDRVTAVRQAIAKNKFLRGHELGFMERHYDSRAFDYDISDSCMASDAFFPEPDSLEVAAQAGVRAIVLPHGGNKTKDIIKKANYVGVAMIYLPAEERCFSHH